MPIGQISFCLCRKSPSRLGKNALRMLYKKWWIKSNKKLNFFMNSWYYVTSLPGSIHILETSFLVTFSLYLHDFLYDVFCLQGKTDKTKWKINKLLRNIFITSSIKTTKTQVTKMEWKQHLSCLLVNEVINDPQEKMTSQQSFSMKRKNKNRVEERNYRYRMFDIWHKLQIKNVWHLTYLCCLILDNCL